MVRRARSSSTAGPSRRAQGGRGPCVRWSVRDRAIHVCVTTPRISLGGSKCACRAPCTAPSAWCAAVVYRAVRQLGSARVGIPGGCYTGYSPMGTGTDSPFTSRPRRPSRPAFWAFPGESLGGCPWCPRRGNQPWGVKAGARRGSCSPTAGWSPRTPPQDQ